MSVKTRTISPLPAESPPREDVLSLALMLSPADQEWLSEQLARLDPWEEDDDDELPESATLDEAIELYLADKCSLGRAAELAGVTRARITTEPTDDRTHMTIKCHHRFLGDVHYADAHRHDREREQRRLRRAIRPGARAWPRSRR